MFESKEEKERIKQEKLEKMKQEWACELPKKDGFLHVKTFVHREHLEDYVNVLQSHGFEIVSVLPEPVNGPNSFRLYLITYR